MDACYRSAKSRAWEPVELFEWRGGTDAAHHRDRPSATRARSSSSASCCPTAAHKLILKDPATGDFTDRVVGHVRMSAPAADRPFVILRANPHPRERVSSPPRRSGCCTSATGWSTWTPTRPIRPSTPRCPRPSRSSASRISGRAPGARAPAPGDPERRRQLLPQRRLRGLLRAGDRRPWLRSGLRGRGRGVRAGPRHRPGPEHQPGGPGVPRGSARPTSPSARPTPFLLRGSDMGLIGYGGLGRALHRLLRPFDATIRAYDPWLPDSVLAEAGLVPATLEEVLSRSTFIFVLATVTAESERLLGPAQLDLVHAGARFLLISRAAVVDLEALLDRVAAGRFLAAIDVLARRADARRSPLAIDRGPGALRRTGRAASTGVPESATWSSTICARWREGCRRSACRWRPASWSGGTGAGRSRERSGAAHRAATRLLELPARDGRAAGRRPAAPSRCGRGVRHGRRARRLGGRRSSGPGRRGRGSTTSTWRRSSPWRTASHRGPRSTRSSMSLAGRPRSVASTRSSWMTRRPSG